MRPAHVARLTLCARRGTELACGEWLHYFPEGRINQRGESSRFRRGVGRIVAEASAALGGAAGAGGAEGARAGAGAELSSEGGGEGGGRLRVLPFYIDGTDMLQPTTRTSTSTFSRPNLGTEVHVIFGAPLEMRVDLSGCGSAREREARFEEVAATLEAEVAALRAELERRRRERQLRPGS